MKSHAILTLFFMASLFACRDSKPAPTTDPADDASPAAMSFQITTFESDTSGIDSLVLRDLDMTLVAVPMESAARRKPISDDEAKCLMKCKKPDGSYDLDCILLCPVSKRFSIRLANVAARQ